MSEKSYDGDVVGPVLRHTFKDQKYIRLKQLYTHIILDGGTTEGLSELDRSLYNEVETFLEAEFTNEAKITWLNLLLDGRFNGEKLTPPQRSAYHLNNFSFDLRGVISATPPRALFELREPYGDGNSLFMPRGKVCILASEGGVGKSLLSLHLGLTLANDQDATSLQRAVLEDEKISAPTSSAGFPLIPVRDSGKVVMLFGEENQETCNYRLQQLLQDEAGRLDERLLEKLSSRLVILPLCSTSPEVDNNLSLSDSYRNGEEAKEKAEERFNDLFNSLKHISENDHISPEMAGWGRPKKGIDLIVIDPLAQFGGGDFEKDNGEASNLMRQFQRLTSDELGNPTVLLIHHVQKNKNAKLSAQVRGASALRDNSRWVGVLHRVAESDNGEEYLKDEKGRTVVELVVSKSNYGPCYQRVRYLSDKSAIRNIEYHQRDLLSARERKEDDNSNTSSPNATRTNKPTNNVKSKENPWI